MKEYPILFSADMVRANHAGIKRMTRRVMKPMPAFPDSYDALRCEIVGQEALFFQAGATLPSHRFRCPYGQAGDRIWIRETWRIAAWRDGLCRVACDYKASPEETHTPWIVLEAQEWKERVAKICAELRKINYPSQDGRYQWEHGKAPLKWHPSIHMPRWACRDVYTVTKVRLERLQAITREDAIAVWWGWPVLNGGFA